MLQVDSIKNKVLWKCRRGMLELDLLLEDILTKRSTAFEHKHWLIFDKLLDYQDPDLYEILMGYQQPTDSEVAQFVQQIIKN